MKEEEFDMTIRPQSPAEQLAASPEVETRREAGQKQEPDQAPQKEQSTLTMEATSDEHGSDPKRTSGVDANGRFQRKITGPPTKEYTCCNCFNHGTTSIEKCDCGHGLCPECELHRLFRPELESIRKVDRNRSTVN